MKSFTFRLPVKKHIKKFLSTKFGDTIPAQMNTDIGFVVLNTISSRIESQVARGYNKVFANTYQAEITFIIPFHYFYLTKKEVSINTCILLNRYFENRFEEEFCSWMEGKNEYGRGGFNRWLGTYRKGIEEFCRKYNIEIEDDISYDGLRKIEYRHRKKNNNLFPCGLSHSKNLFTNTIA